MYAATRTRYYVQVVEQADQTACAITEDPALSPEGSAAQVWITLEARLAISGCPDGLYPFIGPCDGRTLDEGDACASYRLFDDRGRVARHLAPVGGSLEIIDPIGPDGCTLSLALTLPGGITVRETFVTDDISSFDDDPVCGPT
jgi:hypothetical protein